MASSFSDFQSRQGHQKLKEMKKTEKFPLVTSDVPVSVTDKHLEKALLELFG